MKLLLDTCALIWWTLDPAQLTKKIIKKINEENIYISSISVWEVGLKIKNNVLDIGMSIETYLLKLKELGNLTIVPVDEHIWILNLALQWNHKDPADRTIVATAQINNCHIVTTDHAITKFYKKIFI